MRTRPFLLGKTPTDVTLPTPTGIDMSRIPQRLHATVARAEAVARAARGEANAPSVDNEVAPAA